MTRAQPLQAASFITASVLALTQPLVFSFFCLSFAVVLWLSMLLLRSRSETVIKKMPVYNDAYWTDGQLDALENHAYYWLHPEKALLMGKVLRLASAALIGYSLGVFIFYWGLSGAALMLAAGLMRLIPKIDPITFYQQRADAKDHSISGLWEDVMDTRDKLLQESWPWK